MSDTSQPVADLSWAPGDHLGLLVPADATALRGGGATWLTQAFHASGALRPDARVSEIVQCDDCPGGSTGRKLLLTVAYEGVYDLPTELFVKFSRDFDDPIRDRGRDQLEPEVRLGLLSQEPGFPIAVPRCLFADYHHDSGTGLLITARVPYGRDGVEPAYEKCLDHKLPDPVGHYRALLTAVARLAGTHRGGGLSDAVERMFPYDADRWTAADRIRYDARQLQNRIARFGQFADEFPWLVPANIADPAFLARMSGDVPRVLEREGAIRHLLHHRADFIALCHWNANVDNGWYWRDGRGDLQCGLIDWGRVGQMNVAMAIWGCLSAAKTAMWDAELDSLLALFADEYAAAGGPWLDLKELKLHFILFATTMGLAWLMDAPPLIRAAMPDLAQTTSPEDPRFEKSETARAQLQMLTNVLNLWQRVDFARVLDRFPGTATSV